MMILRSRSGSGSSSGIEACGIANSGVSVGVERVECYASLVDRYKQEKDKAGRWTREDGGG